MCVQRDADDVQGGVMIVKVVLRFLALCWCALVLSACGGGGSSSDQSGSGATVKNEGAASAVTFNMDRKSVGLGMVLTELGASSTESVALQAVDTRVAGFAVSRAPGAADADWLIAEAVVGEVATLPTQLILKVKRQALAVGLHTTTLRIYARDVEGAFLSYRDLPVNLSVLATPTSGNPHRTSFAASAAHVTFSGVQYDTRYRAQTVDLTLSGEDVMTVVAGWAPQAEKAGWLRVSLQGQGMSRRVVLTIPPEAQPGQYTTSVRLSALGFNGEILGVHDLPVNYTVHARVMWGISGTSGLYGIAGAPFAGRTELSFFAPGLDWEISAPADSGLKLSTTSGSGSGSVVVTLDAQEVAPGLRQVPVTISTADGQTTSVVLNVNVIEPELAVVGPGTFYGINGQTIASKQMSFGINNGSNPELVASSEVPWLQVEQSGSRLLDPLIIKVNPAAGMLASGTHTGDLVLKFKAGSAVMIRRVAVALVLSSPKIVIPAATVILGGAHGRDFSPKSMGFSLDPPTPSAAWHVADVPSWMSLSRTVGTMAQGAPAFSAVMHRALASVGVNKAELSLTVRVNGDMLTAKLPVEARLDTHRLLPDEVGVAFTHVPGWSRLSHGIKIRDNLGLKSRWSASSNQSWLTVTREGSTDEGHLQLTADPSGLPPDSLQMAEITITSDDKSVAPVERIHVGLWVGASNPAAVTTIPLLPDPDGPNVIVDPVRPLVYVTSWNSGDLFVYNVYSGQEQARIIGLGTSLGQGVVSADGQMLYVNDGKKLAFVQLPTFKRVNTRDTPIPVQGHGYLRVNGKGMLNTTRGIYDALSGNSIGRIGSGSASYGLEPLFGMGPGVPAAAVVIDKFQQAASIRRFDYSEHFRWALIGAEDESEVLFDGRDCGTLNVSPDGSTLVGACNLQMSDGSPAVGRYNILESRSMPSLPIAHGANGVAITWSGRVFASTSEYDSVDDFYVYEADGSIRMRMNLAAYSDFVQDARVSASGDGFMAIVVTTGSQGQQLKIVAVAP